MFGFGLGFLIIAGARRVLGIVPGSASAPGPSPVVDDECVHKGCPVASSCRFYNGSEWLPFCSEHVLDAINAKGS